MSRARATRGKKPLPAPGEIILRRRRRLQDGRAVRGFLVKLIFFALFVYAVFGVCFGLTVVRGNEMKPRFYARDVLLFYRLGQTYATGDVVVFRKDGREYVSRVVACPGDSVEIRDGGGLVKNGASVIEDDIFWATYPLEDAVAYPMELGEGEYFVLCDYRAGARDSRAFGTVNVSEIEGKVMTALRRRDL